MRPLVSIVQHAKQSLLSLLYPPSCAACQKAVADAHAICAECWPRMGLIERPFCERLGTPMAVDYGAGLLSPAAIADPPVYDKARIVTRYDAIARAMVSRLKYGDRPELAILMARMMTRAGTELLQKADVIVPIPLHRARLWSRRFNQSACLAEAIAQASHVPHHPFLLSRVKSTRPQVGLTRAQRRENLQGAFKVLPAMRPALEGKNVLLVDDVLTTGSTANAASRALLRGGAASVDCLAFARVVMEE
jgi:ComF family protein